MTPHSAHEDMLHKPIGEHVDPHEFHGFLLAIMRRVQSTDLAMFEERGADVGELRELATAMVEVSREIFTLVDDHYASDAGAAVDAAPGLLCQEVESRAAQEMTRQGIADLAFVARLGLQGRHDALKAADPATEDRWDIIELANSACREILKSASALEAAICGEEGIPPQTDYYLSERERGVRTRAAYRAFRQAVPHRAPDGDDEVRKHLRISAIAIAKLIGRDIYPSLRVRDRKQIRDIQERILSWLRDQKRTSARGYAGRRIWQDLTSFADLLQQVNNRAELKAHDREVVDRATGRCDQLLTEGQQLAPDPYSVCRELSSMLGRDTALDELIEDGEAIDLLALKQTLVRLQAVLATEPTLDESVDVDLSVLDEPGDFF